MTSDSYVLLLYPPIQLMDVETPRPDGSLGPLYLAAALESQGIPTDILDASVGTPEQKIEDTFGRIVKQPNGLNRIGMEAKDIAAHVKRNGYTAVGIHSNFTLQTNLVFETARAIKEESPSVRIYAGGVNARAMRNRFLASGLFDAVCLTEGEYILPKVVKAHAAGKSLDGIAGVAYNGTLNPVDASCFPKSLDELPSLGEIRDIDKINAELDFTQDQQVAEALAPRLAEQAGAVLDDGNETGSIAHAVEPSELTEADMPDSSVLH